MSSFDAGRGNACAGFAEQELEELRTVVSLYRDADGFLMRIFNWAGSRAGSMLSELPNGAQEKINEATEIALREAYNLAFSTQPNADPTGIVHRTLAWAQGERWHKIAAGITGALGGAGGIATTLVDLPVTTTLILRSIQQVALEHGEDLTQPQVRAQCVAVFGLGGPLSSDDDSDLGLFASRMALGGKTIAGTIAAVLPRYGVTVSQKVITQATPMLGAIAGAAINSVFTSYYQTMAHVHFRLRRLELEHDPDQVRACFERIVTAAAASEADVKEATRARTV